MSASPREPAGRRHDRKGVSALTLLRREDGQGTVEYVLVILAAAAIALALIAWMNSDSLVPNLFGTILKKVIGFVG